VLAPAQTFVDQDLVDPAALDRDPLLLVQVGGQSVERPGGEGQIQALGIGQRRGDHPCHLLGRVGRRATGARPILQPGQAARVEPLDPVAHRVGCQAQLGRDRRRHPALARLPDEARPLDLPRRCGAGMGQLLDRDPLHLGQVAQPQSSHRGSSSKPRL
jgi:hypothetical protein